MKIIDHRALSLGIALLGAGALLGAASPVEAQNRAAKEAREEVRDQRQNVKHKRQNVREADSARERREAAQDLRAAERNLRKDQRDLQNARGGQNARPVYRPGVGVPAYRPGYQNLNRTLEGVVTADTRGNDFNLRLTNGQIIRVVAVNGESNRLSRGDRVRVYGVVNAANFRAQSVSILRNR